MKKWIALFWFGLTYNLGRTLLMGLVCLTSAVLTTMVIRHFDKGPNTPVATQAEAGVPFTGPQEIISQENWQFSLPGVGWQKLTPSTEGIKVVISNEQTQRLVIFVKEPTTESYNEYVVGNMRTISQAGAAIRGAQNIKMNGGTYGFILAGDWNILIWITVKDGFGYVLTCGGPPPPDGGTYDSMDSMCVFIAKSLQIK